MIIEAFEKTACRSTTLVAAGGLAEKNPLLMQIYADVTGCAMLRRRHRPGLRARRCGHARRGGGGRPPATFPRRSGTMTAPERRSLHAETGRAATYDKLLHPLSSRFTTALEGSTNPPTSANVMKDLLALKEAAHQ